MHPAKLQDLSWAMAEVYASVTDQILINLATYFPFIKQGGEPLDQFNYQARMLAQMGQVTKDTASIIARHLGGADAALQKALETAILEGLADEEPRLRKAAERGLLSNAVQDLAPNQMQAFQAYYRQSADKLNLVNTVMLESTQAAYKATVSDIASKMYWTQSYLNIETGGVISGVTAYNDAVHQAVWRMVGNGITGFIDHAGRHWSPEAYVAMDIKTTMFNTARSAVFERSEEYGCDTYLVSSHNGARPLCFPWQQKVISRTDQTRTIVDLDGNEVRVYAQSETTYGQAAGLFGVNCMHYPMTFIPGFSTIKGHPQSEEENDQTYKESQQQRALERHLREEKRNLSVLQAQGAPEDLIKAQQAKVDEASYQIDEFCDRTGRARRKEREYTPVNATFPPEDSYDVTGFPRDTQEQMRTFFEQQAQPIESQLEIQTPEPELISEKSEKVEMKPKQEPEEVNTQQKGETYTFRDATYSVEDVDLEVDGRPLYKGLADVYTMPDGARFVFQMDMDERLQHLTPEVAIEQYYKIPEWLRSLSLEIQVVDTSNPWDDYWQQVYADFSSSQATGGFGFTTFYKSPTRYDTAAAKKSLIDMLAHELGHTLDDAAGGGSPFSDSAEWAQAMAADLAATGKASITTYGENSPFEDFAESVMMYVRAPKKFMRTMPARGAIIERIAMERGAGQ